MRGFRTSDPAHFATSSLTPAQLASSRPPDLRVIEVNTTGTLCTVHLALAYFRAQDLEQGWRGKIVITGSNASFYPFPNDTLYATSKASILGLVRSLGPKVLHEKITVNAFAPSAVRTSIGPQEFFDQLEKEGRITHMETVMRAVDAFTRPESRFTGQIAECSTDKVVLRKPPEYLDDVVQKNLDAFHSVEQIEEALDMGDMDSL